MEDKQLNIVVPQGDDWNHVFQVVFPLASDSLDGATVSAWINASHLDETTLAVAETSIHTGDRILLHLADTVTREVEHNCIPAQVPPITEWEKMRLEDFEDSIPGIEPYVYDLQVELAGSGRNRTYAWGYVLVPKEVTRHVS